MASALFGPVLADPAAQQLADLGHQAAHVGILPVVEPGPVVGEAQVMPTALGSPWLGFVIDRERRLLKARKARFATRRLGESDDAYCRGPSNFAEFEGLGHGWIAHAGHGDT